MLAHAATAAAIATAHAARRVVTRAAVAEDEDWQLHPAPLPGPPRAEDDADALLAAVVVDLDAGGTGLGLAAAPSADERSALAARVALRAAALAAARAAEASELGALATAVEDATRALQAVRDTAAAASVERAALTPSAARRRLPPAPPRPDRVMTRDQGLAAWSTTLAHLAAVAAFPAAAARGGGGLRGGARAVAAFATRRAGALPRSALALVLGLGLEPPAEAVQAEGEGSAAAAPPPPAPPAPLAPWAPSPDSVCADLALPAPASLPGPAAAKFVEQAVLGLQGHFVACLLNPARSRRRHRRCLEDWVHVHQHALNAEADEEFAAWLTSPAGWPWAPPPPLGPGDHPHADAAVADHGSPLSAWTEEAACRAAAAHMGSGFGLSLYAPHEAAPVLWQLDHVCRRWERAVTALAVRWPSDREVEGGGKGGGRARGKARGRPPPPPPPPPAAAAAAADSVAATCRSWAVSSLLRAAAGLAAAGHAPPAPTEFAGGEQRFDARFAALSSLTVPPALAYEDYVASVDDASECGEGDEVFEGGERRWRAAHKLSPQHSSLHPSHYPPSRCRPRGRPHEVGPAGVRQRAGAGGPARAAGLPRRARA